MYAKENPVFSTFLQLLPPLYLFKLNLNILQNILFQNNVLPQGFTRDKLKYIIVIYYILSLLHFVSILIITKCILESTVK